MQLRIQWQRDPFNHLKRPASTFMPSNNEEDEAEDDEEDDEAGDGVMCVDAKDNETLMTSK